MSCLSRYSCRIAEEEEEAARVIPGLRIDADRCVGRTDEQVSTPLFIRSNPLA